MEGVLSREALEDRDERACRIREDWDGIFSPFEAFYIHSIMYSADRCLEAFERYDERYADGEPGYEQVSAIHEALTHAAALSRFFWPSGGGPRKSKPIRLLKKARAEKLRTAFELTDASP